MDNLLNEDCRHKQSGMGDTYYWALTNRSRLQGAIPGQSRDRARVIEIVIKMGLVIDHGDLE